ncbi:hypothetical protein Clacol_009689 [Clathrus columnatus]|uniref:Uncharacterized protein n=1 Tax=Clathrus columnatus TaxID=1419009 RepID=A0AAV5AQV2_9AGAM|nr:hypothetical protein Clacol_009689 [Clathrus columnatus]
MTSQIIPTGVFDTSGNEKDSIVVTGWVLDQVLDVEKIEAAYLKLVQRWPILSARLRTKGKKWVYEIPTEFNASTPQYVFKKVILPGPIEKTYNYGKVSSSIRCTIKDNQNDLFSKDGPRSVGDYMKSNIPVSQLQVTLFDDATLVGLTTPHVLCDGHGNKEIMVAITKILRGEEVEELHTDDPFTPFVIPDDKKDEPIKTPPFWRVFTMWNIITFMAHLMADFAKTRDITNRDVFFPKEEVERIKEQAMADLKKEKGEDPNVWVSSSDALIAFFLKRVHPPSSSTTPLNVLYSANLRRYLKRPAPLPSPFLHNAAMTVVTPTLPISSIHTLSLGSLAYHIRTTLRDQTDQDALETWLTWRIRNAGRMSLFFEPNGGAWNVVTNWRDMKLMYVDFSGALPDDQQQQGKQVKCLYLFGNSFQPFPVRNIMGLVADDPSGGVWMGGFFSSKKVWERADGFKEFIPN